MANNIKELIAILDTGNMSPEEIQEREEKNFPETMDYMRRVSDEAERVVLSKISEETFVKLMRIVMGLTLSAMVSEGDGIGLLMEHAKGSLDGFVHTNTLAILGVLMEEEVL